MIQTFSKYFVTTISPCPLHFLVVIICGSFTIDVDQFGFWFASRSTSPKLSGVVAVALAQISNAIAMQVESNLSFVGPARADFVFLG